MEKQHWHLRLQSLLRVYVYFRIYQKIENRYIVVNETVPFQFQNFLQK